MFTQLNECTMSVDELKLRHFVCYAEGIRVSKVRLDPDKDQQRVTRRDPQRYVAHADDYRHTLSLSNNEDNASTDGENDERSRRAAHRALPGLSFARPFSPVGAPPPS